MDVLQPQTTITNAVPDFPDHLPQYITITITTTIATIRQNLHHH